MITREERRVVHSDIAEWYDRFRPGYPGEVATAIAFLAQLPEGGRILEVGCGTGHGTALFASRGYRITALEPGPGMARVARRRFAGNANVRVIESTFESWEPDAEGFDLVLGASSIHLVEPEQRFAKPARLLRPGGALAVFWHDREPGQTRAHQAVRLAYVRHAPSLWTPNDFQGRTLDDVIDETGLFGSVYQWRKRWSRIYSAEEYENFLESFSTHRLLPAGERAALYPAIRAAIMDAGGTIEQLFTTRLWVARKDRP